MRIFGLPVKGIECGPQDSLPNRLQPGAHDALEQLRITHAHFGRGLGEVFISSKDRIRVGFDEMSLVGRRDTQVHARLAVNCQRAVDAFAWLHDIFGERSNPCSAPVKSRRQPHGKRFREILVRM